MFINHTADFCWRKLRRPDTAIQPVALKTYGDTVKNVLKQKIMLDISCHTFNFHSEKKTTDCINTEQCIMGVVVPADVLQ